MPNYLNEEAKDPNDSPRMIIHVAAPIDHLCKSPPPLRTAAPIVEAHTSNTVNGPLAVAFNSVHLETSVFRNLQNDTQDEIKNEFNDETCNDADYTIEEEDGQENDEDTAMNEVGVSLLLPSPSP